MRRRRNGLRPRPAVKAFWRLHNNNNKWILHNTRNPFASAWAPKPVASALRDVLRRNLFASHCSRHQIVIAPGPTKQTDESQAEQMRKTNAERVKQTERVLTASRRRRTLRSRPSRRACPCAPPAGAAEMQRRSPPTDESAATPSRSPMPPCPILRMWRLRWSSCSGSCTCLGWRLGTG